MPLKNITINAIDLPDLWFQAIYNIIDHGRARSVSKGSFQGERRVEFDFFVGHVASPHSGNLLPVIPQYLNIPDPVSKDYLDSYICYLMDSAKEPNETYTYGSRLRSATTDNQMGGMHETVDQIDTIIKTYKDHGHVNNQMIMQIAGPQDLGGEDPPCLRHIDTKIVDDELHFFPYFRSWDLWSGLPANLAAIAMLQQYMASELDLLPGEMIVSSKGLHVYGFCEELARIRANKV